MTPCASMPSPKQRHNSEDEIVFDRFRKAFAKAFRALILEIAGNYDRVRRLLTSLWIWCLSYIFIWKCFVQVMAYRLEKFAEICEKEIKYDIPFITSMKYRLYWKQSERRTKIPCRKCICFKDLSVEFQESQSRNAAALSSWLLKKGVQVTFDDSSQWDDGVLISEIIQRVSSSDTAQLASLDPGMKVQNWSLILNVIKMKYPGLIKNKLLSHCMMSSQSIQLHHVIELLTGIMHARRRVMTARILRCILSGVRVMDRALQPRCSISGPGIAYAKLNTRNEIVLRTRFPSHPFTVELEDSRGEIWRESSINAKSSASQEEHFSSPGPELSPGSDPPIDIIRVTRSHFRIFYFPRLSGLYKISIRPGVNSGGHIHGSPFCVSSEPASYWRQNLAKVIPPFRKMSSVERSMDPPITPIKKHFSAVYERPVPEVNVGSRNASNGSAVTSSLVDDVNEKSNEQSLNVEGLHPDSRPELRKKTLAIIRQIGTGLSTVSRRMFSSISTRGQKYIGRSSSASSKRRTYADAYSGKFSLSRSTESKDLTVPSSRNLRIRKVIIHRYLNSAMPSLEEYFFGDGGFNLADEGIGEEMAPSRRWKSISALLQVKMTMMKQGSENKGDVKETTGIRKSNRENGKKYPLRPQRSADSYSARPKVKSSRRRSADVFQQRSRKQLSKTPSSSSSENGYETNELETIIDEGKVLDNGSKEEASNKTSVHEVPIQKTTVQTGDKRTENVRLSVHTPRFKHIFENQGGAADILLQDACPDNTHHPFSVESNVPYKGKKPHHKRTPPDDTSGGNRGAGCPPSAIETESNRNRMPNGILPTIIIQKSRQSRDCDDSTLRYAKRIAQTVIRDAVDEYRRFLLKGQPAEISGGK